MTRHAMYYEREMWESDDHAETQKHLASKAVDVYAVRGLTKTTPGESRTSPTLNSSFVAGVPHEDTVFNSMVAPLPHTYTNPYDAVHREDHPAGSNGGHKRHSLPKAHLRIMGAGGTTAQQVFQRQAELNPVSHPMAGGALPPRIDLKRIFNEGDLSFFPLLSKQQTPNYPGVTPQNNKNWRDKNLRGALQGNRGK